MAVLFEAYAASLPIDLGYQDFSSELAGLPGCYGLPDGALLLARDEAGVAIGCAGLRPVRHGTIGEMKRLYVAPTGRGRGLGQALSARIVGEARTRGYRELRLDTLSSMGTAIALYERMGFRRIPAYYAPTPAGTIFMALDLREAV